MPNLNDRAFGMCKERRSGSPSRPRPSLSTVAVSPSQSPRLAPSPPSLRASSSHITRARALALAVSLLDARTAPQHARSHARTLARLHATHAHVHRDDAPRPILCGGGRHAHKQEQEVVVRGGGRAR